MIHLFNRAGMYLCLDTGSGAVHILDETAYALLQAMPEEAVKAGDAKAIPQQLLEKYGQDATDTLSELQALCGQNVLFADDNYEEFKDALGLSPVKAMCLHIAHDCNLRCKYCFASTGGFGGHRKLMDFDTAKKAIDLLVSLSGSRRNIEVDFFGGEPLMNFEVVKQTVDYARGIEAQHNKNFRFTITTNGLMLTDDKIAYINKEMSNVVLSIDGRREVNDAMRPLVNGKGSFDSIVPKYQKLVAGRGDKEYYVRGTYTRDNLDFDKDILALYDLGFTQISVEPVVGPAEDDYSIRACDIPAIEESYERVMQELIARRTWQKKGNFNFFHFMLDLDNGPCAIKRLKGCGSGNEYLAVTPNGELYPCHQFVGTDSFIMGSVDAGLENEEMKQEFADANIFHKPTCGECWAKFFCSGGCNANNHTYAGSVLEPYEISCKLEKIRLECAIAVQAALAVAP